MRATRLCAVLFTIHDRVAQADVELGKRIYQVRSGCIDCHGANLAGAKIMEDPAMGNIWGANLTPANLSGWTDEEIARAFRYGIHKTGRSLRFMPAFDYQAMSLDDAAALVAYIRSVPAVDQPSHENTFGPVAKTLSTLGQMPVMFPARVIAMPQVRSKYTENGCIIVGNTVAEFVAQMKAKIVSKVNLVTVSGVRANEEVVCNRTV